MKNRIFTLIALAVFVTSFAFAQKTINPKADKKSAVPAYRTCGTMDMLQEQLQQDPTLAGRMADNEAMIENWINTHKNEIDNKAVVTIPVVVHVLWNTAAQNISDAMVQTQIDVLNKDYRKTNTDIGNVPSVWTGLAADFEINFCLAQRKPDGTATNGIERRQTTTASFGQSGNPAKYYAQGGLDAWDATQYLNIWVCNLSGGLLGYAQFPTQLNSSPATDGVVILYSAFGLSGTSAAPYNLGRSATHEIGHWLNLYHIWGDDGGTCTGDDYCNDTPKSADATYGTANFPKTDACSPNNPGIMFMNYMDYTNDAYMYMFTANQKARAVATLSSLRSGLATSNGCQSSNPTAPVAAFTASTTTAAINQAITFTDQSTGVPTSWAWTFGDGGTSTVQNPSHTYTVAGTYNVALTATNSLGNNTMTKNSYIVITAGQPAGCDTLKAPSFLLPCGDSLVSYKLLAPQTGYVTGNNSYGDLEKAERFVTSGAGTVSKVHAFLGAKASAVNGNISAKIYSVNPTTKAPATLLGTSTPIALNTVNAAGSTTFTFATPVSVSNGFVASIVLPTATGDTLIVYSTKTTCNTPDSLSYELWSDNTWWAFVNPGNYGINFDLAVFPEYCTGGVGITENSLENITVYPNPTNGTVNVVLRNITEESTITVTDMIGQTVVSQKQKPIANKAIQFDLSSEPSGVYYINVKNSKESISRKISIIK